MYFINLEKFQCSSVAMFKKKATKRYLLPSTSISMEFVPTAVEIECCARAGLMGNPSVSFSNILRDHAFDLIFV